MSDARDSVSGRPLVVVARWPAAAVSVCGSPPEACSRGDKTASVWSLTIPAPLAGHTTAGNALFSTAPPLLPHSSRLLLCGFRAGSLGAGSQGLGRRGGPSRRGGPRSCPLGTPEPRAARAAARWGCFCRSPDGLRAWSGGGGGGGVPSRASLRAGASGSAARCTVSVGVCVGVCIPEQWRAAGVEQPAWSIACCRACDSVQ